MAGFGRRNGLQARNGGPGFGKSAGLTPMAAESRQPGAVNGDEQKRAPLDINAFVERLEAHVLDAMPKETAKLKSHAEIAAIIEEQAHLRAEIEGLDPTDTEIKDAITVLLNIYLEEAESSRDKAANAEKKNQSKGRRTLEDAKEKIQPLLFEHIDPTAATELERTDLAEEISDVVSELLVETKINLNKKEQRDLVTLLLNDMLGLGPLEPLLADETITDIMVNGPNQIYVEQGGKLQLTDVKFRDSQHLMNIATRIVTAIGRRVDETQPICDARLLDGSRVNVIIPPLAIDGASISIRKFSKKKITLDRMVDTKNLSDAMCRVLKIAGRCRLNILISGGTGSGKTTMLNAISRMIDGGERVVTIEDAAELQLQQPHVVRLETRPPNLEGQGEITMRDLVKNALRMRPDRIILGEIRGSEAIDMLQAMNTGHDGSLGTLHANRPREALTRLENMVNMAGLNLPPKAIRTQISDALHMIVQVSRMRDGVRRVQYISEVVGMEEDVITTQDLFVYRFTGEDDQGKLQGEFQCTGVRPKFYERAEYYGLGRALMEAIQ
ncbi:MAG: CpaF family protein [Sphingomonadales bacterium]|jgi:pilus assembly protein CpaF